MGTMWCLYDSLDLDVANRERTRMCLFQLFLHDQARNWLETFYPAGSIVLGESLSKAWTRFKDLLQKVPHHGIDLWLEIQIFYDHVSFHLKCEIDRAAGEKEKSIEGNKVVNKNVIEPSKLDAVEPIESIDRKEEMEDETNDQSARNIKEEHTGRETKAEVLVEMPRYGILGYSGMVFCTSWVRRIELLGYGVRQWSFDSSKSWIRRIGLE
ncbi:hypothetical protein Tco_0885023 [Tanacetum coccineum]